MSATVISFIVFACVFGGALIGFLLRAALPEHHLNTDTKDVVKLGIGLIGTMTALLLGLLIASAKDAYDTEKGEVTQMSAKIVFLDSVLSNYGPETKESRDVLRGAVEQALIHIWQVEQSAPSPVQPSALWSGALPTSIQKLLPQTDSQRSFKETAAGVASEIGQMRWLLFEQTGGSIATPFLVVVICWLSVIFVSFGLFAPRNATATVTLILCPLSASAAIFLILELDDPFAGVMQISSETMRNALAHLGR